MNTFHFFKENPVLTLSLWNGTVKQWLSIKVGVRTSHFWYDAGWHMLPTLGLYIPDISLADYA